MAENISGGALSYLLTAEDLTAETIKLVSGVWITFTD